jgi:hypothetical protein
MTPIRRTAMPFKVLALAHAPDGDPEVHRSSIDTGLYQLHTVVVRTQAEALEICREFGEMKAIDSVLLCPGFTHREVAEIAEAVGHEVGVSVGRGDGPSSRATKAARERAGYPGARPS